MKTPETEQPVERHPLKPFVHADTRVLFLGSFPPPKARWCMDFFYPNFINDHWRIEGLVFYQDKNYFVDEGARCFKLDLIVDHCLRMGIGFFDTATAVRRLAGNASDKFLEVVQPTDIHWHESHRDTLCPTQPDRHAEGRGVCACAFLTWCLPVPPSVQLQGLPPFFGEESRSLQSDVLRNRCVVNSVL